MITEIELPYLLTLYIYIYIYIYIIYIGIVLLLFHFAFYFLSTQQNPIVVLANNLVTVLV